MDRMIRDFEIRDRIRQTYDILGNMIQEYYRNNLRPMEWDEFNVWFEKDKLAKRRGLPCFLKVVDDSGEVEFIKVYAVPWIWKVHNGKIYVDDMSGDHEVISVYMHDDLMKAPIKYRYGEDSFHEIGLYCDDTNDFFDASTVNPMLEINAFSKNGKK